MLSLGIEYKSRGPSLLIKCPNPSHGVDEHFGNCSISFKGEKPYAKCFACGFGGDLLDVVQVVRNCSFPEAVSFLNGEIRSDYFLKPRVNNSGRNRENKTKNNSSSITAADIPKETSPISELRSWQYLGERGFSEFYLRHFNIGLCQYPGVYYNYMITPLPEGNTFEARKIAEYETFLSLGFEGSLKEMRSIFRIWQEENPELSELPEVQYLSRPKVLYPSGTMQGKPFIFNQNELDYSQDLFICEGTAGVPKVWNNLSRNVTATFGTEISPLQIEILSKFKGRKIFIPDQGDPALIMLDRVSQILSGCHVIPVTSEDQEPDHVEQLQREWSNILPAQEYVLQRRKQQEEEDH